MYKHWGLLPKTQKKFIQNRTEFDYLKKLNKDQSKWLNAFNLAVANGDFKPLEDLGVKVSAALKNELNSDRYTAEICSEPNNAQAKKAKLVEISSAKYKKNLIESLLSDLDGDELLAAQSEAMEICSIMFKGKK